MTSDIPEPGVEPGIRHLREPAVLKAVAHPARARMLFRLTLEGPATATECAELTGLSPSACSWHLRALARAGLVGQVAGADRRETRWRALQQGLRFLPATPADPPEYRTVQAALSAQVLAADVAAVQAWWRHCDEEAEDPAWLTAAELSDAIVWLTADELVALRAELRSTVHAFVRRDPATRPPGARQVQWSTQAQPFELGWLPRPVAGPDPAGPEPVGPETTEVDGA